MGEGERDSANLADGDFFGSEIEEDQEFDSESQLLI